MSAEGPATRRVTGVRVTGTSGPSTGARESDEAPCRSVTERTDGPAVLLAEAGTTITGLDGRPLALAPTAESASRLQAAVAANPALHAQLTRLLTPT
jgi:hypothetical protein